MKKAMLLLAVFSSITIFSQTTESRPVKPFSVLELNGAAKVEIISYDSLFCKVTADPKDAFNILVVNKGDRLIITTTGMITKEYKILLGCKGLKKVDAQGASKVESDIVYKTDNFGVEATGASKTKLMVEAKNVDVKSDGAAGVQLQGKADSVTIYSDGSSKVRGYSLEAKKATVNATGTANVVVNAKESLAVKADGASRVYYAGNPANKTFDKTGVSHIKEYTPGQAEDHSYSYSFSTGRSYGKSAFKHWMGPALTFNGYTTSDFQTNLPAADSYMEINYGRSLGWSLNVLEHHFHIWKNYINLGMGIGFDFNRYHFRNKIALNPDSSYVTATYNNENNYRKNLLKASYVTVPVFFEINTSKNPERTFHIAAGALFGLKMGSKTKQYYDNEGYRHYVHKRDDYNLNPFRAQAMLSVGYAGLSIFANYSLTTLFERNKGPELYPFTIGIRFFDIDWD